MLSTTSPVTAPPKISVILAAGQPSSCRPTTDRGCKRPFKEPPLTAESGGATRAALLAMRAHRGTGRSNPLPSSGESSELRFGLTCSKGRGSAAITTVHGTRRPAIASWRDRSPAPDRHRHRGVDRSERCVLHGARLQPGWPMAIADSLRCSMVGNAAPLGAGESIDIAGSPEAICEDIHPGRSIGSSTTSRCL